MTSTAGDSVEEFYAARLSNASVLERASRGCASDGDAVGAVALAWAADVEIFQAALWERLVVVAGGSIRDFLEMAERAMTGLGQSNGDAEDLVQSARNAMVESLDTGWAREVTRRWTDISYLAALPAPSRNEFLEWGASRLQGLSPSAFVTQRRAQGHDALTQALERRVKGQTDEAIRAAYAADCLLLEAYLVESALAAGDQALLSVAARWELATRGVASMESVPPDFSRAVGAIRAALARPLGDADGPRFRETLPDA